MTATRKHLMNAKLIGRTQYDRWKRKFEANWNEDALEAVKAMMWKGMAPAVKEQLRLRAPDAAKDMDERYGGGE